MFHRKDAVLLAVAGLLASSGFAMADTTDLTTPALSLDPAVVTAQSAPASSYNTLLMQQLDKAGIAKMMYGISISGFVEAGYSYGHRGNDVGAAGNGQLGLLPGPFNHEVGNHLMLDQFDLQFARTVDATKFLDVGGMIEVQYGTDAGFIHSSGLPFNGNDPTDDGMPHDNVPDKYQANYQFDVTQAYLDVSLGNNLFIRGGKFVTLFSSETINPTTNLFYSHSWSFNSLPFTQTGILANYKLNDQWNFIGGVTRGWDMSLEDTNGSIDALGEIAWTPNSTWEVDLNWGTGPEDKADDSHYRTVIDPIVKWQATQALKVQLEGLYIYDGGLQGDPTTDLTHAYGDVWAGDLYLSYVVNDYVTANARLEGYHNFTMNSAFNVFSTTLGVTVTPLQDPIGKNLSFRPEIRYDFTDGPEIFATRTDSFKDQLTFAIDAIFKF